MWMGSYMFVSKFLGFLLVVVVLDFELRISHLLGMCFHTQLIV
jgi:hypothetical protein